LSTRRLAFVDTPLLGYIFNRSSAPSTRSARDDPQPGAPKPPGQEVTRLRALFRPHRRHEEAERGWRAEEDDHG
jgi:hypothetical protein